MTTIFSWNGSFLGNISKENIIARYEGPHKRKIMVINIDGHETTCYYKNTKSSHQCICDELKYLFFLRKIGTHWVRYGEKRLIILYKIRFNHHREIVDEWHLNELNHLFHPHFITEVQQVFAFRDVLNLRQSFERHVIVREPYQPVSRPYPISADEVTIDPRKNNFLSNTIMKKWFHQTTVHEVLREMFQIKTYLQIDILINKIRTIIQNIIKRIDKSQIWLEKYIIDRLRDHLSEGLTDLNSNELDQDMDDQSFKIGRYIPDSPIWPTEDTKLGQDLDSPSEIVQYILKTVANKGPSPIDPEIAAKYL